jgi:hypothetical protein
MPEIKKFVILEFIDKQGYGAKLITNYIYTGLYHSSRNSVEITDPGNHIDWVFYNNDTCVIIPNPFEYHLESVEFAKKYLPADMEIIIVESMDKFYIDNPDAFIRSFETILYSGKVESLKSVVK